jgi:hypothetical protein
MGVAATSVGAPFVAGGVGAKAVGEVAPGVEGADGAVGPAAAAASSRSFRRARSFPEISKPAPVAAIMIAAKTT